MAVFEQLVILGQSVDNVEILFFGKKLQLFHTFGNAGVDYHVAFVVNHRVEFLRGQAEEVTNLIGKRTEVPDVRYRNDKAYGSTSTPCPTSFATRQARKARSSARPRH